MNQTSPEPAPVLETAPMFADESARLQVLWSHDPDALEDDPELCTIVSFAAKLCNAAAAQVTLVEEERQRFLAREGITERETPRALSFCAHTMLHGDILEVQNTTLDPLFCDNPLVTGAPKVRYYAGYPLVSQEGAPLGALCVIDLAPHDAGLSNVQREGMAVLAQAVMRRLQAQREFVMSARNLAQSEQQLRALADSVPAIVWSANADGQFDYFNKRLTDFIGGEDTTGSAIHPDDFAKTNELWRKSLAEGSVYEAEHRLRHVSGEYRWMLVRALPVRDPAGNITRWFGTAVDIDDVHRTSENRALLGKELAHRIKNLFAVVTGLIALQARAHPQNRDFADEVNQTLMALGRAHEFVQPTNKDQPGSLRGLLEVLFAPYALQGASRVQIIGNDTPIAPRAATPLALIFHELATNSTKYGALSAEAGHITLTISDQGEMIGLDWLEHGGPAVEGAGETGFGSRLVEMSVTGQLGGSLQRSFDTGSLEVRLTISKQAVTD